MTEDSRPFDRFKPVMPRIPGVNDEPAAETSARRLARWMPPARIAIPLAAVLLLGGAVTWWVLSPIRPAAPTLAVATRPAQTSRASPPPQSDPWNNEPPPQGWVVIATLDDLAQPWTAKKFFFRKPLTGEAVPAMVVRLPAAAAGRASPYWAFSLQAPYGRCELEYMTDLRKLSEQSGYPARHPMVLDPCSGTLYDPLGLATLRTGVWARGEIVKGPGIRPPLSIDVRVQGNQLMATRIE